jgi:mannose-6-phosphate isomerase-like protein (cupin superfamily)
MWRREVGDRDSASPKNSVNLKGVAATAGDHVGVIWTLDASSDLIANLVRSCIGQGVGEHVNKEVEVIVLGVSGSGIVTVDQEELALSAWILAFIAKGVPRSTVSTSEDFVYPTVHHRWRPLHIGH